MPIRPPVLRMPGTGPAADRQRRREVDADRYARNLELRRWYMRTAWRNGIRPAELAKQPMCVICKEVFDRDTIATDVHHCVEPLTWDQFIAGPFANLCADCHRAVTAAIRYGRRPFNRAVDIDGYRIAERHDDLWRRLGAPTP